MTPADLVKGVIERGANIKAEDGRLFVRPSEALPEDLKERILARKAEVIAFLENAHFDRAISDAVTDLNRQGVRMQDIPEEKRCQSDKHEADMNDAANLGDREAFDKALAAWRQCFTLPSPSADPQHSVTAFSEALGRRILVTWAGDASQGVFVDGLPFTPSEVAEIAQANPSAQDLERILMIKKMFGIKPD